MNVKVITSYVSPNAVNDKNVNTESFFLLMSIDLRTLRIAWDESLKKNFSDDFSQQISMLSVSFNFPEIYTICFFRSTIDFSLKIPIFLLN